MWQRDGGHDTQQSHRDDELNERIAIASMVHSRIPPRIAENTWLGLVCQVTIAPFW
jgi:hypothetical protein